jgi:hypothetical protein
MESESFRSRVMALIQKSRRALRLYSSAGNTSLVRLEGVTSELSNAQVAEWREINGLLLRKLTEAIDSPNAKKLVYDVFALRNEFHSLWRTSEGELVASQRELVSCAERGDFIKATSLSTLLVSLKARVQAGQAAHHELDTLIKKSRVVRPPEELSEEGAAVLSTLELLDEQVLEDIVPVEPVSQPRSAAQPLKLAVGAGKVIPLKPRF